LIYKYNKVNQEFRYGLSGYMAEGKIFNNSNSGHVMLFPIDNETARGIHTAVHRIIYGDQK
jgi:hypothetical protein